MLLSDGYLANGSEPWRIPELDELPDDRPAFATEPNHGPTATRPGVLALPARRGDPGAAVGDPRHPGLEHRIGGLEKGDGHGNISYDPANHDFMVRTRQAKVDRIAESLPPLEVDDPSGQAKVLVLGWGSTYGPIGAACRRVRKAGYDVAQAHLRHLNPLPERPRRDPQALRRGAGARDEPRPALAAAARRSTSSTSSATTTCAACRSRPPSSPTPSPT
jgi:2-oxoglutarate ferredoxin oxidoreductase subunit alpha